MILKKRLIYLHQFKGVPKVDSKKLMKLVALRRYDGKPGGTETIDYRLDYIDYKLKITKIKKT